MRVHVDADKCQGHNRCYSIAPELFDVDDLGYADEVGDGTVPAGHEERARLAVMNCPEHAIELTEDDMKTERPLVTDWSTDFDHTDPQWVADPFPIWDELRQTCPVAHSDRYGGTWLPVRHDDVAAVAYDTEHFTSRSVVVSELRPGDDDLPHRSASHHRSRPTLRSMRWPAGCCCPRSVRRSSPATSRSRASCAVSSSTRSADADTIDAAIDYAQDIPLPRHRQDARVPPRGRRSSSDSFIHMVLEDVNLSAEERQAQIDQGAVRRLHRRADRGASRRATRRPHDVPARSRARWREAASRSCRRHDGAAHDRGHRHHLVGDRCVAVASGPDTPRTGAGWRPNRSSMTTAVEEFLPGVRPGHDGAAGGQGLRVPGLSVQGGRLAAAALPRRQPRPRDRSAHADEVHIDRAENRHAAFGLGIHRCLGSNLARMELRVALEEWMARYPDFELTDPSAVTWSAGQVRGPRTFADAHPLIGR